MDLLQHTLFINLEHRTDRLQHVTKEFEKMGIVAERVNAIRIKTGAIGCTLSHIRCLEIAKQRNYDQVFICEDDIYFTNPELLKRNLERFRENADLEWDLLILGGNNVPPYDQVAEYCARVYYCQTTTGYIVKKHYYDTLLENFKESAQKLIKEPNNKKAYALDMYWKRLQLVGKWYMITPPTVTQIESYSDIENRSVNYEGLLLDMDKPWLFRQNIRR
jgi:GR25 family glycosyltransferase involved in LPS biosynthesis